MSCTFYLQIENDKRTGVCRRYPPQVVALYDGDSATTGREWPEVDSREWCGAYEFDGGIL